MLQYPKIDPVALKLGFISIHWYGLMYVLGFLAAWALAHYRAKQSERRGGDSDQWTTEHVSDLIFYCALGVIVGGHFGYMLFYSFYTFITHPWTLFYIWEGGMSFHGGLLGVIAAIFLFARKYKKSIFAVGDFIAPLVPIGLGLGRIGNFINGELWGEVTSVPWGMVYPHAGPNPRHPSQLYEFLLEGIVLFIVIWFYSAKPRPQRAVGGLFLLLYGLFRFFVEFFRQPDPQLGYLAFGWLTMGQLLSLPMMALGVYMLITAYQIRNKPLSTAVAKS